MNNLNSIDFVLDYISQESKDSKHKFSFERIVEICKNKNEFYESFAVPKKNGGFRDVLSPNEELRTLQIIIKDLLEHNYNFEKVPKHICGYVKGRGIKENASFHVDKKYVLNVDIKDFFNSVKKEYIRKYLSYKPFSINRNSVSSIIISEICTFNNSLPTGSVTSPFLSNIVLKELDYSLTMLAVKNKIIYSRYVDDLTFSTNKKIDFKNLVNSIGQRISKFGYKLNKNKTRLQCWGSRQIVTGLVVNKKVSVKREFIDLTKVMLNNWWVDGYENAQSKYVLDRHISEGVNLDNVVRGRIDFIGDIMNPTKRKFHAIYIDLLKRYWVLKHKMDYSKISDPRVLSKLKRINFESEILACNKIGHLLDMRKHFVDLENGKNIPDSHIETQNETRFILYCFNVFRQLEILYKYYFYLLNNKNNGKVIEFFCKRSLSVFKKVAPRLNNKFGKKDKIRFGYKLDSEMTFNDINPVDYEVITYEKAREKDNLRILDANVLEAEFFKLIPDSLNKKHVESLDNLRKIRNHYAHSGDNVFGENRHAVYKIIESYSKEYKIKLNADIKIDKKHSQAVKALPYWIQYKWLEECNFEQIRSFLLFVISQINTLENAPNKASPSTG